MALSNYAKGELLKGNIDCVNDTIKVMLLTSSHTTNVDTQDNISDVNANEVTGAGYTAGGATLANKSVTVDDANDKAYFDADNVTWSSSTITARYAVIYKDTGTPATSTILDIKDFGQDETSSGGNFTIQWDAGGIFDIS